MTRKEPLISVVMPVYNAGSYLRESIDSILRQTYSNFEFIIINDGSTDGSQKIIDHYKKIDKRIISFKQKNSGVVATANRAIKLAKGEYISRTDADDVSFDTKLEDLVNCAKSNPKAIVICGSIEVIDERSEHIYRDLVLTKNDDIKRALYVRNPIPNGATLVKKSALEKVGYYDKVFAEDCHMWTKLYPLGDFIGTGTTVYRWRMNSQGLTMTNRVKSYNKEQEYVKKIWELRPPSYINRRSIVERGLYYQNSLGKFGRDFKNIMLADLSRLSFRLIRKGQIIQGIRQVIATALSGRAGYKSINRELKNIFKWHIIR